LLIEVYFQQLLEPLNLCLIVQASRVTHDKEGFLIKNTSDKRYRHDCGKIQTQKGFLEGTGYFCPKSKKISVEIRLPII